MEGWPSAQHSCCRVCEPGFNSSPLLHRPQSPHNYLKLMENTKRYAHYRFLPALGAGGKRLPRVWLGMKEEPGELAAVFSQGSFSGAAGSLTARSPRNRGPD